LLSKIILNVGGPDGDGYLCDDAWYANNVCADGELAECPSRKIDFLPITAGIKMPLPDDVYACVRDITDTVYYFKDLEALAFYKIRLHFINITMMGNKVVMDLDVNGKKIISGADAALFPETQLHKIYIYEFTARAKTDSTVSVRIYKSSKEHWGMQLAAIELAYKGMEHELSLPIFSMPSGNYRDCLNVKLKCLNEDCAKFIYTLDGSEPNGKNGLVTDGYVDINSTSVLKVRAIKENAIDSPVAVAGYVIGDDCKNPIRLDCGGNGGDSWISDVKYLTAPTSSMIRTGHVPSVIDVYNPPPNSVWQTARFPNPQKTPLNYIFGGYDPNQLCLIRIHSWSYWGGTVHLYVNGAYKLTYVCRQEASHEDAAYCKEFTVYPNENGSVSLNFIAGSVIPDLVGIEVLAVSPEGKKGKNR